jgi:hypothetical protein
MTYTVSLDTLMECGGLKMVIVGKCFPPVTILWSTALGYPLRDLHGRIAGEVLDEVRTAVERLHSAPNEYVTLDPARRWGRYGEALRFLEKLEENCAGQPLATLNVQR